MILNVETGLTLKALVDFLRWFITQNKDAILQLKDTISKDYEVPDADLDALEHKQDYSPNDIRTLLRATGMDYDFLTSDQLPDNFEEDFRNRVQGMYNIRNQFKSAGAQ